MLLKYTFSSSTVGVKLHTRSDERLINPARLKAKSKVKKITVQDLIFADDAALLAHSTEDLQTLLNQFSSEYSDVALFISFKN